MENYITVKNLTKKFGTKVAVNDLSFSIQKGEILGLLGANGAGKSTSIECILGIKRVDNGKIEILGMNPVKDRKKIFEQVGVQFQQTNYQEKIKVKEACETFASLYKDADDWERLLERFELSDKKNQTVNSLSGGERQRLSVLLALISKPKLVFLDELTTGLDSKARRSVWKYLNGLKRDGLTILLTSHYMDEVEALCDKICIIKNGEKVVLDTVENIIRNSPYKTLEEAYLYYSGDDKDLMED